MRKLKTLLVSVFIAYSLQLTVCYADSVLSNKLIEKARGLDGTKVTYKGEVVTAILNRGEYSWVNLNDGDNAIGIWCKTASLGMVKFIGDYK
ncbi:MAG: DNA-binding protein, partial [Candidatus Omnitrophica bacterium]|nr:DNA-binding protein [Candidatus Omnitrophota bacterium]